MAMTQKIVCPKSARRASNAVQETVAASIPTMPSVPLMEYVLRNAVIPVVTQKIVKYVKTTNALIVALRNRNAVQEMEPAIVMTLQRRIVKTGKYVRCAGVSAAQTRNVATRLHRVVFQSAEMPAVIS